MNDSVSILVAVVLILVALRWMLGGSQQLPEQQGNARRGSPRRPQHRATPQMIEMVRNVFPNIPTAAIVADLQRTGNVERTIDNALRDGGLPLPPPPTPPPTTNSNEASSSSSNAQSSSNFSNLVQRYHLEKADGSQDLAEPEKVWGTTADKRQEVLRKRKEFMVLQARRRMMEKQKEKEQQKTSPTVTTTTMATATEEEEKKSENPSYDDMSVEQLNALSPEERRQQLLDALERRNVNS
ncbi:predicted protein [Lichtheimia corymbifera JMRC:FSU:9682]|uniref:CUE domain-containing protein n=1 Tax=Lichtheimia corymbifera JMRC:FSU:9682 TaxID=1263082 RepID=A0A068SGL0_9FUNG|nr:predicted protein [Lichtheimia corymbifera JMRC:FSU:9682]